MAYTAFSSLPGLRYGVVSDLRTHCLMNGLATQAVLVPGTDCAFGELRAATGRLPKTEKLLLVVFKPLYIHIYIQYIIYICISIYIYRGSGCHVMQRLFQDVQQMSDFCKVSWVSKQPAMQNDWPPTSTADRCGDSMP